MKVAIISYFNEKTQNLGGILQAYALNRTLSSLGYEAEDINFCPGSEQGARRNISLSELPGKAIQRLKRMIRQQKTATFVSRHSGEFSDRRDCIARFKTRIPSTPRCDQTTVSAVTAGFDAFICGSDQIWNAPIPEFFLSFAPAEKIRFSYAASFADRKSIEKNAAFYREHAASLDGISLREKSNCAFFSGLVGKECVPVLDPTLLLTEEDWNDVCAPRLFPEDYVFCYFLGEDRAQRSAASQYALDRGLKLVTIPHLNGYTPADVGFGDSPVFSAGPGEFISLIRYADRIFTDSFHCCVISLIYGKTFRVFGRSDGGFSMNVRIRDLLELSGLGGAGQGDPLFLTADREALRNSLAAPRKQSVDFIDRNLKNAE